MSGSSQDDIRRVISYLLVASLWGITNPYLKKAASSSNISSNEPTMIETLLSLVMDHKKLIPFILNQCGSLLFYFHLASEPVMIAAPLCNSLTFAFTALAAYCLGERPKSPVLMFLGVGFVLLGIYVSFLS